MIKSSRMLAVLMVLCLLLPLTGWTEAAHTVANPKSPEELAAEYLPKLVGSWVGYQVGDTVQFTWYPDGRYEFIFFNVTPTTGITYSGLFPDLIRSEPVDMETVFEGDLFTRKYSWGSSTLRRMKAPYVRLNAEDETACAPNVPEIIGTFGGKLNGVYVEWTFHGDGRFTQVTPTEELTQRGCLMAGGEEFAVLLDGKIMTYKYRITKQILMVTLPEGSSAALVKKAGPLVQLPPK